MPLTDLLQHPRREGYCIPTVGHPFTASEKAVRGVDSRTESNVAAG
ncbi:MAG: hypothetical protein WAN66_25065 [Limnoraphis robusta]|nr:hypothetical protein [Limnoraphis robusta]